MTEQTDTCDGVIFPLSQQNLRCPEDQSTSYQRDTKIEPLQSTKRIPDTCCSGVFSRICRPLHGPQFGLKIFSWSCKTDRWGWISSEDCVNVPHKGSSHNPHTFSCSSTNSTRGEDCTITLARISFDRLDIEAFSRNRIGYPTKYHSKIRRCVARVGVISYN